MYHRREKCVPDHRLTVNRDIAAGRNLVSTNSIMKVLRIVPLILILVGAIILFERPAYAYADPGSGLLAIQAAGSALIATGWYLRRKIYALFHRSAETRRPENAPGATDTEDPPRP
jgi:hypothetical protein